jgi:hypothetical protein
MGNAGMGSARGGDAAADEAPPPNSMPVKRPDEGAAEAAARAQVFGFLQLAEPELHALEALETEVREKLLELGRYFGEPTSVATFREKWNRGCLHQTKSSGISLRCTCLALPATRWLDVPRERAVHRLIGWKHC